jgi:hypothetical protein
MQKILVMKILINSKFLMKKNILSRYEKICKVIVVINRGSIFLIDLQGKAIF